MSITERILRLLREYCLEITLATAITVCLILALAGSTYLILTGVDEQTYKQHEYTHQIITVGDIKWICLQDHNKTISCQIINPNQE